jgi:hypothetical protein
LGRHNFYFASIGSFASSQPFHPPASIFTLVNPFFIIFFATRALLFPLQEQQ